MSLLNRMVTTAVAAASVTAAGLVMGPAAGATPTPSSPFIARFHKLTNIASTVPGNGDVNPYGVAVVEQSRGRSTVATSWSATLTTRRISRAQAPRSSRSRPAGIRTLFSHVRASQLPGKCPGGVGLTTALVALRGGWVIVGSLPSTDGTAATAQAGCLIVLDSNGVRSKR